MSHGLKLRYARAALRYHPHLVPKYPAPLAYASEF